MSSRKLRAVVGVAGTAGTVNPAACVMIAAPATSLNMVDATVGTDRTYVELGYLQLNRDIDFTLEDLQDREEIRVAGRVAFARYWSVFGSAIVDLTKLRELSWTPWLLLFGGKVSLRYG